MSSIIKSSILVAVTFFFINGAYGGEENIYSIIDGMKKRFSINIIYNKEDLKDNERQPIIISVEETQYKQEELIEIIEKTARVKFEKMSEANWIIKRPRLLFSDRLDQMQAKLIALEDKVNDISNKIDNLGKLIEKNIESLKEE